MPINVLPRKPRIDFLTVGDTVRLAFHGSKRLGNEEYTDVVVFLGIEGTGDERRAVFGGVECPRHLPEIKRECSCSWQAFRFHKHWAYGSSAERLSLVEVVKPA